jgi:ribosomal protein S27E
MAKVMRKRQTYMDMPEEDVTCLACGNKWVTTSINPICPECRLRRVSYDRMVKAKALREAQTRISP